MEAGKENKMQEQERSLGETEGRVKTSTRGIIDFCIDDARLYLNIIHIYALKKYKY